VTKTTITAAQGAAAKKATAEGEKHSRRPWIHRLGKRATPVSAAGAMRAPPRQVTAARVATNIRPQLLTRQEVVALAGVTYPTIWLWMREGRFPRSRAVGGKSMWLASEIDAWVAALPVRSLKPLNADAAAV
jgi:predicted DNA-binding transcriptional regulator AlpA